MKIINIEFKNNDKVENKKVEVEKLLHVLSKLENAEIKYENQEQIDVLMNKYGLYDESFLNGINEIW